jgi:hypothetical protein
MEMVAALLGSVAMPLPYHYDASCGAPRLEYPSMLLSAALDCHLLFLLLCATYRCRKIEKREIVYVKHFDLESKEAAKEDNQ